MKIWNTQLLFQEILKKIQEGMQWPNPKTNAHGSGSTSTFLCYPREKKGSYKPFNISKHLRIPKKLVEVNVEHVTWLFQHDVVVMTITDTKNIGSYTVTSTRTWEIFNSLQVIYEPTHEILALFVLRKFILQIRMRSHPVGLDVWFLVWPFVYFHSSCVRTAKAMARLLAHICISA